MTREEMLTKMLLHLSTMEDRCVVKAAERDHCVYRAEDGGGRCLVGALIPDELYDEEMEGAGIQANSLVQEVLDVDLDDLEFVHQCQLQHDQMPENYKYVGASFRAFVGHRLGAVAAKFIVSFHPPESLAREMEDHPPLLDHPLPPVVL